MTPGQAIQHALDSMYLGRRVKLEAYRNNESIDAVGVVKAISATGVDKLEVYLEGDWLEYNEIYSIEILTF